MPAYDQAKVWTARPSESERSRRGLSVYRKNLMNFGHEKSSAEASQMHMAALLWGSVGGRVRGRDRVWVRAQGGPLLHDGAQLQVAVAGVGVAVAEERIEPEQGPEGKPARQRQQEQPLQRG